MACSSLAISNVQTGSWIAGQDVADNQQLIPKLVILMKLWRCILAYISSVSYILAYITSIIEALEQQCPFLHVLEDCKFFDVLEYCLNTGRIWDLLVDTAFVMIHPALHHLMSLEKQCFWQTCPAEYCATQCWCSAISVLQSRHAYVSCSDRGTCYWKDVFTIHVLH